MSTPKHSASEMILSQQLEPVAREKQASANVRVRELPPEVDILLNALAAHRSLNKWEIIRVALVEFVENHKAELPYV